MRPTAGPRAPRLVATDLDGTLVRSDGSIGGRTVEVVERLEQAGATFVMVTGRPPRWMAVVADEIGHHGLAVCANGAILYDLRTERVVRAHLLEADTAFAVVEALRRDVPGIAFAVEKAPVDGEPGGFAREHVYVPRWDNGQVAVEEVSTMVAGGAVKLLARSETMGSDDLLAAARACLGEAAELTHSSDGGLLEIDSSDHRWVSLREKYIGDVVRTWPMRVRSGPALPPM